jgi:hypothetical protein
LSARSAAIWISNAPDHRLCSCRGNTRRQTTFSRAVQGDSAEKVVCPGVTLDSSGSRRRATSVPRQPQRGAQTAARRPGRGRRPTQIHDLHQTQRARPQPDDRALPPWRGWPSVVCLEADPGSADGGCGAARTARWSAGLRLFFFSQKRSFGVCFRVTVSVLLFWGHHLADPAQ